MGFTINFVSFGCNHLFCDLMVTSLHEATGKSLVIFQTILCKNNFRLSFDSYERFILAHTTHSSMTRFLVLKNQLHDIHCMVIFYFCLFFIDVSILFFDIFLSSSYQLKCLCMPLIATFLSHVLPLIATYLSPYLLVSACH